MIGECVTAEWHDGRKFLARLDERYDVAVIVRPEKEWPGLATGPEEKRKCDQPQLYHKPESPQ